MVGHNAVFSQVPTIEGTQHASRCQGDSLALTQGFCLLLLCVLERSLEMQLPKRVAVALVRLRKG